MKYNTSEIKKIINGIKSEGNPVTTNYYFNIENSDTGYETFVGDGTIIYIKPNVTRKEVTFFTNDIEECKKMLSEMPPDSVIQIVDKTENEEHEVFRGTGYGLFSIQQRVGSKLLPYDEQVKWYSNQRWDRFYDESFVGYATEDDLEEIQRLIMDGFDPYDDDFFDDEEMLKLIGDKNVMISRQDGKITTFHIFRIQGKKMYANHVYNTGWGGALYSLEKFAVLDSIKRFGVIYKYGWIRLTNESAWKRNLMDKESMYNYTFRKVR